MKKQIDNIAIIRLDNRMYEKNKDKILRKIRKIFLKVNIEKINNMYVLLVPYLRKYNKIVKHVIQKQIDVICKKNKYDKVMLESKVCNIFELKQEKIINGKSFYKLSIDRILKYIFFSDEKMSQENIYFFVNEYNNNIVNIIEQLENKFKTVNIITQNLKKFKSLEEKLFCQGYLITVSNNKRKSAKNAKYIINYDFKKEEFEKYNINRKAIIINLTDEKNVYGLSFNGVIVNDFNISISTDAREYVNEFYGHLDEKMYLELIINKYGEKKEIIDKIYNQYDVKIVDLLGVRGIIQKTEFLE